jgi:iron complex outermembrane receptor protein
VILLVIASTFFGQVSSFFGQSSPLSHAERSIIVCTVTAAGAPVAGAEIVVGTKASRTDSRGEARIDVAPGHVELTVAKPGFVSVTASVTIVAGQELPLTVELEPLPSVHESVTVSATRTERGLDDQPMRVEVLDHEEIDEKLMMTPGDVVMMLNEMGGMRVQATSPSLGAASVRIQGMKGRYTRFLSDGLPLFGERVSLGLTQIPPMDLGRVEVIKGATSSLYGAGAIGGVVNLVARRPGATRERQVLINRSSRGATDAAVWYSGPLSAQWGLTLLASVNGHQRNDIDRDGWADTPRYERAVVRPRLYWDNHAGRSFFATVGGTWEDRVGGSMPGTPLPAAGRSYVEALKTRRSDVGATFQTLSARGVVWTARGSWTAQHQDHEIGDVTERDDRSSGFAEVTARRAVGRQTLVGGVAIQHDNFRPLDLPPFAYVYTTPGVFLQDDVDVTRWLVISASARLDRHNRFGTFISPNISGIVRRGMWSSRLSYGAGFSAPTPITEETDAAGLSRLAVMSPLMAERGTSTSVDITRTRGPLSATLTLFHSRVDDPVEVDRSDQFVLANQSDPATNTGIEALAIWKADDFSFVANYAYVGSRETIGQDRQDAPLTPRHSIGLDAAWEWASGVRLGVEWFYTGTQRLEANPYRDRSQPYSVFGVLATRRLGRLLLFVNGENLTGVRQTRWDPLVRPTRGVDGRWTVDAWAPLEGRNVNGGIRVTF